MIPSAKSDSTKLAHHKVSDEFNATISELDEGEEPKVFASMRTVLTAQVLLVRYAKTVTALVGAVAMAGVVAIGFVLTGPNTVAFWVLGAYVISLGRWLLLQHRIRVCARVLDSLETAPPELVVTLRFDGDAPKTVVPDEVPMYTKALLVAAHHRDLEVKSALGGAALAGASVVTGAWGIAAFAAGTDAVAVAVAPLVSLLVLGVAALRTRSTYWTAEREARKAGKT